MSLDAITVIIDDWRGGLERKREQLLAVSF
jgi:hypothetical protein